MNIKDTQRVLKHIPHLEELMFIYGNDGLIFIDSLLDRISKRSKDVHLKIKMDGAPSLICGYIEDKFFVATKSLFNKKPKINYTPADITKNHPDSVELQNKLDCALKYLQPIIPNNGLFYQGDLLFTAEDLKFVDIFGTEYEIFKPNILVYGNPEEDSPSIKNYKMGIVFHTSYSGGIDNMLAEYNPKLTMIRKSKDVFVIDNNLTSYLIDSSMKKHIGDLRILIQKFKLDLSKYKLLSDSFCQFFNSKIRSGERQNTVNSIKLYEDFIVWGRDIKNFNSELVQSSKDDILNIFKLYNKIVSTKNLLIITLNVEIPENFIRPFLKDGDKFKEAEHEGFVAITPEAIVKLVNRNSFSFNNFNLPKDWE